MTIKPVRALIILLLLTSILLVIVSSWSVATFLRLEKARDKYDSDKVFESACQLGKTYVDVGFYSGIVVIVIGVSLMIISSILISGIIRS